MDMSISKINKIKRYTCDYILNLQPYLASVLTASFAYLWLDINAPTYNKINIPVILQAA